MHVLSNLYAATSMNTATAFFFFSCLSGVASRIMGGNGVVVQSNASSLRQRAGMELPVGKHIVPDKPLSVNDELMWDNGTAFPEPCIDRIAHTIGKLICEGLVLTEAVYLSKLFSLSVVECGNFRTNIT
ncbi:NADH dehydrogenase [ubiquinone] 1 beta subcomplex subunit 8, mitochondrial-like [Raphanus sativus]|uniref:NADH dehydrogenase [ubiquinone] 1 beta subcomplex subunit 8, mitochondrial-like n=1 Tax=Raphanus sativus TaxID=3726 RepID=A0A6J0KD31_RAPSA|nr:NADH dehydrogenase [ubiquinone] 1 beta subcomplex subunit 8, mitochondrial-like [Raphanus sativus]